jgi:uridylate kinase
MKKKSQHRKYRKIILKLSGEFLGNQGSTFNQTTIQYAVEQITQARKLGTKIGIVVGAGNIIRGRDAKELNKIDADLCGMMGTVINGLTLCSMLKKANHDVKISSAFTIDGIAERFNKANDLPFYDAGGIIVFVGGTGNPLFTTDTAAALRAAELNADVLIKGTKVAGVYSSDPHHDKQATFYKKLTYDRVIAKNIQVMDLAAFNMCREARIPIHVYNFMKHQLADVIDGKNIGTIVSGG